MLIALFGPPGVGKGTQAVMLVKNLHLKHISTGDILRAAMKSRTHAGELAREYVTAGRLVPGKIVRELAEDAMTEAKIDKIVLDGYPRTIEQAEWLDEFLASHGKELDSVISIRVPDERIVNRLSKRRINAETGETYHLDFKPPPRDLDPALVVQRKDDLPSAIRARLKVYRKQTKPLELYFANQSKLKLLDGVGSIDEVHERLVEHLQVFS
ncbi:MAG: adenylate kinase [Rhodothermales bacterium]|nr:adenylate kinase [Rhodothermales bacterium]